MVLEDKLVKEGTSERWQAATPPPLELVIARGRRPLSQWLQLKRGSHLALGRLGHDLPVALCTEDGKPVGWVEMVCSESGEARLRSYSKEEPRK